jgi:agmatinase
MVGGDHSVTLGALRALAKLHGPLGLVHFDAHCDTYPPAWDIDVHHGTVFRNAAEEGLLRAADVLQIGIRGPFTAASDLDGSRKLGFRVLMVDEVKRDLAAVERQLNALAGRGAFYVSFDMDALDPAYAPGTGTPVPGGLTSYEALALLRALAGLQIIGCDVVEISPDHDATGNTALLAATLLAELLAVVARNRSAG